VPPEQVGWAASPALAPLDEAGVQQALAEGLGSFPELELELRVLRWWRGNDAFRCGDAPIGHPTSPEALANMERFIEMTTTATKTCCSSAEAPAPALAASPRSLRR